MEKPVGFGIAGAGAIALRGALAHLSMPDVRNIVRLAAICDPVPGRAEAAAKKFGVAAFYERYEDLLADPNVDAVSLCTPIGLHYEQGMAAIAAGKHLHANKTMTITVAEADQIISAAKAKNLCVVASPGQMAHPTLRRARKIVLEGKLGTLAWAISGSNAGSGTYHLKEEFRTGEDALSSVDPTWYFKKPGGGPQYDVTAYNLHSLTGILGPAQRVTALSGVALSERLYHDKSIPVEMDDNTILLLDFGANFFAVVYATLAGQIKRGSLPAPGRQLGMLRLPDIFGTAGSILENNFGGQDIYQAADEWPYVSPEHASMKEAHVFNDMMELVDCIQHGVRPVASAEHARHVIDIIESGYRAATTGMTQQLHTTFEPLQAKELENLSD